MGEGYITLENLRVYKAAVDMGDVAWEIYEDLHWQIKKIMGDQFIRSVDSVGANIAEGYGRFHYLDRIKFYYNARASLLEAKHWVTLLNKRKNITDDAYHNFLEKAKDTHFLLNTFIKTTYFQKNKTQN